MGLEKKDDFLCPLAIDVPPAPCLLLKIVECSCQLECSSTRCSCCKNDLTYTAACKTCKGTAFSNPPKIKSYNNEENFEA